MICPSCAEERASRNNRLKISSCEDCDADHLRFPEIFSVKCDCQLVGHDKSKLKKLNDLPKSLQRDPNVLVGNKEINKDRMGDVKKT